MTSERKTEGSKHFGTIPNSNIQKRLAQWDKQMLFIELMMTLILLTKWVHLCQALCIYGLVGYRCSKTRTILIFSLLVIPEQQMRSALSAINFYSILLGGSVVRNLREASNHCSSVEHHEGVFLLKTCPISAKIYRKTHSQGRLMCLYDTLH